MSSRYLLYLHGPDRQAVCLDHVCLGPVCLDPVCLDPVCLDPVCLDPVCLDPISTLSVRGAELEFEPQIPQYKGPLVDP